MDAQLARAKAAVGRFEERLTSSEEFNEDLAREYNQLKRALAASFQSMALEALPRDEFPLMDVKAAVSNEMRRLFEGRVDSTLFRIRRYGSPHPDLYALLASKVGKDVPGWRLRLLTGDKIHTERRTRELRDLGLSIAVTESLDDTQYRLLDLEPDLVYGAAFQLRENASKSRALTKTARDDVVRVAEAAADLPSRSSQ